MNEIIAQPKRSTRSPLSVDVTLQNDAIDTVNVKRSPFNVSMRYERFAQSFDNKNIQGCFLGRTPAESRVSKQQFGQICRVSRSELLKGPEALEPTPAALERTQNAAKNFFALSYQITEEFKIPFPLAGLNKCLGMVAVPSTKLVIIAISQDTNPENDTEVRQNMVNFLSRLNTKTNDWTFELALIPTQAQYFMPRTIAIRTPQAALDSSVEPHTRCVEVALMAALCKAGRTKTFTSADTGIIAFGGALWAHPNGNEAIPHFHAKDFKRSTKYTEKAPLEVVLTPTLSGWIDIWEPCPQHCKIYKYEMLAIGASGGFSSSFFEPRAENDLPIKPVKPEKNTRLNQRFILGAACGTISVAIGVAALYVQSKNHVSLKDKASVAILMTSTMALMASLNMMFSKTYTITNTEKSRASLEKNEAQTADTQCMRRRSDSCPF